LHVNKNQLQELLLGIGLILRDLEFARFVDADETPMPEYLANSCMEPTDIDSIATVLQILSTVMEDQ